MSDPFEMAEEEISSSNAGPAHARLAEMAAEAIGLEELINSLEEQGKELKGKLNKLKTVELPDLMAECGTSLWKDPDTGHIIEISDFVSGSLPKDGPKRKQALEWLAKNEVADLIKMQISVAFEKREHNLAKDLSARLKGEGFEVFEEETVHAQTLLAHVRERLRNGDDVPLETLGIYAGRTAKIKPPKKGK